MINHSFYGSFKPDDFKLIADEHDARWQAPRTDRRGRTTAAKPPTAAAFTKLELDRIKVTLSKTNQKLYEKNIISKILLMLLVI